MIYRTYDDWKLDSGYEDGDAPEEVKIVTSYDPKPIPCRDYDWSAVTDNYDGEGSPCGWGATEKDAMIDLQEQLDDQGV